MSVLLRNRHKADSEEQQEEQMTATEAGVEQPTDIEPDDVEQPSSVAVAEPVSETSIIAEAAAAAEAIMATTSVETETFKEDVEEKLLFCVYCEQPFPPDAIDDHITLDHTCDQCGRKFRQPANLRKVNLKFLTSVYVFCMLSIIILLSCCISLVFVTLHSTSANC